MYKQLYLSLVLTIFVGMQVFAQGPTPQPSHVVNAAPIEEVQVPPPPEMAPATVPPTASTAPLTQDQLNEFQAGKSYYRDKDGNIKELQAALVSFDAYEYDFGNIPLESKIPYHFVFENKGTTPLVISNAWASCDCTDVYWPETPIAPGEKASIHIIYDSKDRLGKFFRTITFSANTLDKTHNLYIKGVVVKNMEPIFYEMHDAISE